MKAVTDAVGIRTEYEYDIAGNVTKNLLTGEEYVYNVYGEIVAYTDAEGNTTVYTYDGQYIYTSAFSTAMDMTITTRSAGEAGTLLCFRDSFASAMLGDLAISFSGAQFERAVPYRIDLLETVRADVVIVEIAERNLRTLIGCDGRIMGDGTEPSEN